MVGDIFQPTHLLFVLVVALLVLGPKRLPEVGRTLGSGIRDFRNALSGEPSDRSERSDATHTELSPEWDPASHEWPDEAVGPTSYDEPVEAASAEPAASGATAGLADAGQPDAGHSDAVTDRRVPAVSSAPSGPDETSDTASPHVGEQPEEDLAASEHELTHQTELAHQSVDSPGSSERQSDTRD
ncbi:MAG TPA: twin-arginine translocase TatA/TatE family subunit [Solirubrobacteraceae bacterium]|nr:twin-arginine translocase TatA/TatE family subunit [Solirubrobacteraceae bacterium]